MTRISPQPRRVALIEDDEDVRAAIAEALHLGGFHVDVYAKAEWFLRDLSNVAVDVVVTDLDMPGIDGLHLVARIREHGIGVPVIVITGRGAPALESHLKSLGVYRVLVKPFSNRNLMLAIARSLSCDEG